MNKLQCPRMLPSPSTAQAAESRSQARSRREFASDETNGGRRLEAGHSQSEAGLRGEDIMASDTM